MRSIKKLPEAVHSSIRSGIILYDLTRVVEELVYNSLDAGANKVIIVHSIIIPKLLIFVLYNGLQNSVFDY